VATRIYTNRIYGIPDMIIAHLMPEDAFITDTLIELYSCAESIEIPDTSCDGWEGPIITSYMYKTNESFKPFDLWPYSEAQWANRFRNLTCVIKPSENDLPPMDSVTIAEVFNLLYLKYSNDSTNCFIPADNQKAIFQLLLNSALVIDTGTQVNFYVIDADKDTVYKKPLSISNIIPGDPGNPHVPQAYSIEFDWNGRRNKGNLAGHLADPEKGEYKANVAIINGSDIMNSNRVTFNLVPKIDSILITHMPSYPPPTEDSVYLYAVIKGKVDDAGDSVSNFRYYIPQNQHERQLSFWNGTFDSPSCEFYDLERAWRHQYYYENNEAITKRLRPWLTSKFGELRYRWKVIHDYRVGELNTNRLIYTNTLTDSNCVIDTSIVPNSHWAAAWKVGLTVPDSAVWQANADSNHVYMRLLTYSTIQNIKDSCRIQYDSSQAGPGAHKVIFGNDTGEPGFDIVDWAITHIGTPYYWPRGNEPDSAPPKIPYRRNDCAGLVTTVRIQQIGSVLNRNYAIAPIVAQNYADGYYGNGISTLTAWTDTAHIMPQRGDLIFMHRRTSAEGSGNHVMLIYDFSWHPVNHRIERCKIIHDYGTNPWGRVRFDHLLVIFRHLYSKPPSHSLTFLKWTE
jgi:hypothetical protein